MRTFNNLYVTIKAFDYNCFANETNLLRITRKPAMFENYIKINGITYVFHQDTILVDMSDTIRVGLPIKITLFDSIIIIIDYQIINGFSPISEIMPPPRIPFLKADEEYSFNIAFYLPRHRGQWLHIDTGSGFEYVNRITGVVTSLGVTSDVRAIKVAPLAGEDNVFDPTFDATFGGADYLNGEELLFRMVDIPCGIEHVLLEWIGESGTKKSWFFQKLSTIRGYDKTLDILKIENQDGYTVLKNKMIDFDIGQQSSDLSTRKYLADIMLSDDVQLIAGDNKHPVFIDNSNMELSEREAFEDITFSLRYKKFRTI